jgi:hypothetical protein
LIKITFGPIVELKLYFLLYEMSIIYGKAHTSFGFYGLLPFKIRFFIRDLSCDLREIMALIFPCSSFYNYLASLSRNLIFSKYNKILDVI